MSIKARLSADGSIWRQVLIWSTLLLFALVGCASTSTQTAPTSKSQTGTTPTPIPTISPTSSIAVQSYQPHDYDPFQANFTERAPTILCPHSSRPTDLCFNVTGAGDSVPYGSISFSSFDINFLAPGKPPLDYTEDQGYCEPTTRQGTIYIGNATAKFTASGTWCWPLVHFVYHVIGGTGTFRHAHGKGSIFIPNPTSNIIEYWTGTLIP
jgi:hypothetical protein